MQGSLLGGGRPRLGDLGRMQRTTLGRGAWLDHLPGWVSGHQALFDHLFHTTQWHEGERWMYERLVRVPRLTARIPRDGPGHPLLRRASEILCARYRRPLVHLGLACYRTGDDSVALHGDRLRQTKDAIVAILAVGEPRRFLLKPRAGGRSLSFQLGWGDLLVMGGTCQETWLHGIPKSRSTTGPRISVQFREASDDV